MAAPQFVNLYVPVTPPSPLGDVIGGHVFLDAPDQGAGSGTFTVGGSAIGDGTGVQGPWQPYDAGLYKYVTGQTYWVVTYPLGGISVPLTIRVYVVPYGAAGENPLVRFGLAGATPSATITIQPFSQLKSGSGTNSTTLLVHSISASVGSNVLVGGKLLTPISITTDLTGVPSPPPSNWAYQIFGYQNNDLTQAPLFVCGPYSSALPFPGTSPADYGSLGIDGITAPHTIAPDTPSGTISVTLYAVSGLFITNATVGLGTSRRPGVGHFVANNIVPGITPSCVISYGTVAGQTLDLSAAILATLNSTQTVLGGLFGVAPNGITNSFLAALAVATANIQTAAVATAQLASGAATTIKIANAAVGTAQVQNAAITNVLIANAAVGTAQIQNAAITNVLIANASINDAKITDLAVSKLTAGTISAAVSLTAPTLVITSGVITVNIDGTNLIKATNSSSLTFTEHTDAHFRVGRTSDAFFFAQVGLGSLTVTDSGGAHTGLFTPSILQMQGLPSSSPGAGSKEFWYDPTDSNRVKFAA